MKKHRILISAAMVLCAILLMVIAVYAQSDKDDYENSTDKNVSVNADTDTAPVAPQNAEMNSQLANTEETANDILPDDGVQRVMTEEMKAAIYNKHKYYVKEYDPNEYFCVSTASFYEASYYANDMVNGYTLCHYSDEWSEACIVEYVKDGYYFTTGDAGYFSELKLYLYKDCEFIPIEEAFDTGLVTAAEIHAIVSRDKNYEVGTEPPID